MDYSSEFEITDDELKMAYKILFNKDEEFEENKKEIIKSFESCYIEASPGSGKTTTLVAKLIILAEKLKRKKYSKGICILTHTNVGIDVIKEKLGSKGDILFKYPNFVGTLQSFIDTYLAIPYFRMKYKKKVELIDNDFVNSYYYNISCKDFQLKYYLNRSRVDTEKIIFDFKNKYFLVPNLKNNNSDNYKKLYTRIEKGFLKYSEAIQLGNLYIKEFPNLKKYFSERFFLVQIDEMQDTPNEAFEILENLFDKEKITVQYIGDKNQNILGGNEQWYNLSYKSYSLNNSQRFGENIASFLNSLMEISEEDKSIKGNVKVKDFKPILILHNFSKEDLKEQYKKIFDKFIEIIHEKELEKEIGDFKIIGRIGKENSSEITISTYFNNFSQKNLNNRSFFNVLLSKNTKNISEVKRVIKTIEQKMNYFFKVNNQKSFQEYLKENDWKVVFNKIIYQYLKDKNELNLFDNLFCFSETIVANKLNKEIFDNIFTSLKIENEDTENNLELDIYTKENINLKINTVHSVKGETHLATLYLDTFYKKYDVSNYLFNSITGNLTNSQKKQIENRKIKNILFVGASRPKYLLCFVCKNILSTFDNDKKDKLKNVFEIIEI